LFWFYVSRKTLLKYFTHLQAQPNFVNGKVYELYHLGLRLDCCLFCLLARFLLGGNEILAVLQFYNFAVKGFYVFPFFFVLGAEMFWVGYKSFLLWPFYKYRRRSHRKSSSRRV